MSDTLLSYAVTTVPSPLQASVEGEDPVLATLIIVVSNSTHKEIDCESISFSFIKGTNAKDFFTDSTGISAAAPDGWSVEQEDALFTAKPDTSSDGKIGADGLTFALSNIRVNEQPGTTEMTVTEVTASGNTSALDIPLVKFPQQFEVGDLTADPDTVVVGGSTVLSWSGSGSATYQLHYTDANGALIVITHPVGEPDEPLPSTGSYRIDNVQKETDFYLLVTLAIEGQDEPLRIERYFPVSIESPDVKIVPPSGASIGVTFNAAPGDYIIDWSAFWETGETAGTATNSMTVTSEGGPESIFWEVPMDIPPPYGAIISANCTVTGFPSGAISVQWP